jgi:hypothetical protein
MKTRNRKAMCGNCPYWASYKHTEGVCVRFPPAFTDNVEEVRAKGWEVNPHSCRLPLTDIASVCGEHPDFFAEENDK